MLDCRALRGADSGSANNSYHALVHASVRLRLKKVHRFANAVELRINGAEIMVLSAQMNPSSRGTITLDGVPLEEVSSFKYLEASFTANGQAVGEIAARITLARSTFN